MNKNNLIISLVIAIIVVGGYSIIRNQNSTNNFYYSSDMNNTQTDDYSASGDVKGTGITNDSSDPASRLNKYSKAPTVLAEAERTNKQATIKTAKGDIVIKLFGDEAPLTVSNFIFLANDHFYDGIIFHRREDEFVIQGGDPMGKGYGGPGYRFEDEPVTREYKRGIVAMANSGPDTNGSQFFVMLADVPLPPSYTIFGEVTAGDKMESVTISNL